ncbi:Uncharacterized protein PBTT_04284 [Plasmodiophora brassicae]|uniref:Uncharacterized protein n=1 Tax=Plasmodiophora brassicae TaxID=37360 RepID=A0A0G4IGP6_PLABS|nr:hypothetical protein PBRA_000139 [Plasmodiophora brassicae]SPQ96705.1 unnamed protein product [Plasmodiophora brassicae]
MTILHPLPPAEEPSPLLLLLQAELKLAQRDAHALGESYSGRHNVCAAKRPRNKYTPERNGELAPSSKRQRTSEAPAPMTVETCRMLSEHDRRHIVSECYEVNPSVDQLHKIRSISPVLASLMTPDEIQTCDRVPKMCMARQIQLHRFVRTFGSRFDHVSSTASCQTLNGLVQYFTGQLMRLLEDDIAVTNQCRSAWMQKRFDDLKAAKFTLETKWTVSERDPSSTSSTSSSPTSHCGHSMVFTRTAGGTHSDQ